jgi:hypothetical protein
LVRTSAWFGGRIGNVAVYGAGLPGGLVAITKGMIGTGLSSRLSRRPKSPDWTLMFQCAMDIIAWPLPGFSGESHLITLGGESSDCWTWSD